MDLPLPGYISSGVCVRVLGYCDYVSIVPMQGGPSPRSCHKMCLDVEGQLIYILGRYLDPTARSMVAESNDSTILPVNTKCSSYVH